MFLDNLCGLRLPQLSWENLFWVFFTFQFSISTFPHHLPNKSLLRFFFVQYSFYSPISILSPYVLVLMARLLSQSLTRKWVPSTLSQRLLTHFRRSKSNSSGGGGDDASHPHIIEIDLDSSTHSSPLDPDSTTTSEFISGGIHRLEDVIHTVIVRRSAPDWLPFLPGYSYWVPPRHLTVHHPHNIVEVIGKISAAKTSPSLLSDDELMAVTSARGWPSSNYFFPGINWTDFSLCIFVISAFCFITFLFLVFIGE